MFDFDNFFLSTEKIPPMYTYLEEHSEWGADEEGKAYQYVNNRFFKPALVADRMGCLRQTVYVRMHRLEDEGWIKFDKEKNQYILLHETKHGYSNVDASIVKYFQSLGMDEDIIALYSYLSSMWDYHRFKGDSSFFLSRFHLVKKIYKRTPTEEFYDKIDKMFHLLQLLNLIECFQEKERDRIYITNVSRFMPPAEIEITEFKPYGSRKVLF